MNGKFLNKIVCADALSALGEIEENSIDVVLTDPPYFLDKLDNNWDAGKVACRRNQQVVKSLPAGMKFDRRQGLRFYEWYLAVSRGIFRVLKPGGFFFSFSSPRLYHRMASAMDDAGFELRDSFIWLYTKNQAKAMGVERSINKMRASAAEKKNAAALLRGWKTPQLKSCFEPIAMGQKPPDATYLKNMLRHGVGLLNTNVKIGAGMHPANVAAAESISPEIDRTFLLPKPSKRERGGYNTHKTVKPLSVCEYLIRLSAFAGDAVVLDPFAGSGTTAVAAKRLGRNYIGIELNRQYAAIAEKRLAEAV
ncbi:MAG: site-specific DNA-methyltransferase [Elusimicrobiales bacterium]